MYNIIETRYKLRLEGYVNMHCILEESSYVFRCVIRVCLNIQCHRFQCNDIADLYRVSVCSRCPKQQL